MLLMIDNYDSFTYNLVQYFAQLGHEVAVHRNDEISIAQVEALAPRAIVISPGPSSRPGAASTTWSTMSSATTQASRTPTCSTSVSRWAYATRGCCGASTP